MKSEGEDVWDEGGGEGGGERKWSDLCQCGGLLVTAPGTVIWSRYRQSDTCVWKGTLRRNQILMGKERGQ